MESDELLVTPGLSSYESDLRMNWIGNFGSMRRKEKFECYENGRFLHI